MGSITPPGRIYTGMPRGTMGFTSPPVTTATAIADITPGGVITDIKVTGNGSCTSKPTITIAAPSPGPGTRATAVASINTEVRMVPAVPHTAFSNPPLCTTPTQTRDAGLALAALDPLTSMPLNGTGLPANCWPTTWPTDGRPEGVPNPLTAGPAITQIGTEGGLLPAVAVIPSAPINYEYNRRNIVVLNVSTKGLFLGPAERADVIIDFSSVPDGSTLIFYNDSPAPVPAADTRLDFYTGDPDQTSTGGAPTTLAGFCLGIRTLEMWAFGS